MTNNRNVTDVAIIGAGPVGLFAIFECGMLKMNCHVVDALEVVGGQCAALYPEKPIYDIPAHPSIDARDLIAKLRAQAAPFNPVYHLGQQVATMREKDGKTLVLGTSKGATIEARAVIVAAGVGAFGPNRPPLENIGAYEDKGPGVGVHYMVTRRDDFAGKRVVIAGGGDSAVDWALSLSEIASSVAVVHRRPKFRAAPNSVAKMRNLAEAGKIEMAVPYQLHALDGNGDLNAVVVKDLGGNEKRLEADALLPFHGLSRNLGPIAEWGLNLSRNHVEVNPTTLASSVPGIHAIGDIATYDGKLKLILCGFSEAAMAAHAIHGRVHPGEALHFEYSTSKGVPAE